MSVGAGSAPRVPVVIVGLDCITGLQTARIYWERGVPVIGVASDRKHFAARTRACRLITQSPTTGDALVRHLVDLSARIGRRALLVPCTDGAVATIARFRQALDPLYLVPLPDEETVLRLLDKVRFEAWAREQGLPVPRSAVLRSATDVDDASRTLTFPLVVKPAVKTERWKSFTKAKVLEAADAPALSRIFETYGPYADGGLTAQEWIVGPETELYSCNAYFAADGRPLASFVARKLRQWPPRTGTSCLGEACENPVVLDTTMRLFADAGFHGLAYLEMKRDVRTGQHFIIEPNVGRPTGRSAIAEAGGVELLMSAYADMVGEPLPEARRQLPGDVKWIYLRNDVLSAVHYWRRGELSLGAWARSWQGRKVDAVWSPHDPRPFAADLAQSAGKVIASAMNRLQGAQDARSSVLAPR